jgi:hypothetical protein
MRDLSLVLNFFIYKSLIPSAILSFPLYLRERVEGRMKILKFSIIFPSPYGLGVRGYARN